MRKDLEAQILERYPELFKKSESPSREPVLRWGFECEDGWFTLIDALCATIMSEVHYLRQKLQDVEERLRHPESLADWQRTEYTPLYLAELRAQLANATSQLPTLTSVKQKWGALEVYPHNRTLDLERLIEFAHRLSLRICELCGTTVDARPREGRWIRVTCPSCSTKSDGPVWQP